MTIKECATFAILCAKACCKDEAWTKWADSYLAGKSRDQATMLEDTVEMTARASVEAFEAETEYRVTKTLEAAARAARAERKFWAAEAAKSAVWTALNATNIGEATRSAEAAARAAKAATTPTATAGAS